MPHLFEFLFPLTFAKGDTQCYVQKIVAPYNPKFAYNHAATREGKAYAVLNWLNPYFEVCA